MVTQGGNRQFRERPWFVIEFVRDGVLCVFVICSCPCLYLRCLHLDSQEKERPENKGSDPEAGAEDERHLVKMTVNSEEERNDDDEEHDQTNSRSPGRELKSPRLCLMSGATQPIWQIE